MGTNILLSVGLGCRASDVEMTVNDAGGFDVVEYLFKEEGAKCF